MKSLESYADEATWCARCALSEGRSSVVFGRGVQKRPGLVLVGDSPSGPGQFDVASQQLLERLIGFSGLTNNDVYYMTVVCCQPPQDRAPSESEIASCGYFRSGQLNNLWPKAIMALGRIAACTLLVSDVASVESMRGTSYNWNGFPLRVTYHPAVILEHKEILQLAIDDFRSIGSIIQGG